MERLTNAEDAVRAAERLGELIETRGEWFYIEAANAQAVALRKSEADFRVAHGRLLFSCQGQRGVRLWRIVGWEWTGEKLLLQATGRAGGESALLELIPRASSSLAGRMVAESRRALCNHLASLACEQLAGAKIERLGLSAGPRPGQPGRYARIHLGAGRQRIAVTGPVAPLEPGQVDAMLSSALVWHGRALEASVGPVCAARLWLVVETNCSDAMRQRVALLREELRRRITLYEMDEERRRLTIVPQLTTDELWAHRPPGLPRFVERPLSEVAERIVSLAPEAIDAVRGRHGETLRFHGLPFARVRRVMNHEHVWYGASGARRRRLLCEDSEADWTRLIEELKEHRRAHEDKQDPNRHHAFYRAAPEAWLESMLRRDITRLDPGLVIAPLHAQFRAQRVGQRSHARPVDLLALRRDGRLVVIELKVSEDREHVLQGADYWRRVEAQRRCGRLSDARLFGDARIMDAPPLVYLVAPTLRFHRAFDLLARSVSREIEMYRFDLNENWRAGVQVMRRARIG